MEILILRLHYIHDVHGASSNDFDSKSKLKMKRCFCRSESRLVRELDKDHGSKILKNLEHQPKPPFTTSTLQQEAARKLRMSANEPCASLNNFKGMVYCIHEN